MYLILLIKLRISNLHLRVDEDAKEEVQHESDDQIEDSQEPILGTGFNPKMMI